MRVTCRSNRGAALSADYLDPRAGLDESFEFPLSIGRPYVVYGVLFRHSQVWYLLADDNELPYPMAYPAPLFDVRIARPSRYWVFALTQGMSAHHAVLAPQVWVEDPFFYDRLTNGEERALREFAHVRALMDHEDTSTATQSVVGS